MKCPVVKHSEFYSLPKSSTLLIAKFLSFIYNSRMNERGLYAKG